MVLNMTELAAANAQHGVQWYWQRGMAANDGMVVSRNAAANAVDMDMCASLVGVGGFTLFDDSNVTFGLSAAIATTGITNANPPVVNTGSTALISDNDVVRLINNAGALQLGGLDFTIDNIVANTSFELRYMRAIAAANPGAGFYRKVYAPDSVFYPRWRYLSVAQGVNTNGVTTVTAGTTVANGYQTGQQVRFVVPSIYGYSALNGATGAITAQNGLSAFNVRLDQPIEAGQITFPLTGDVPFSPAIVVPVGEGTGQSPFTGQSPNGTNDATLNNLEIGIELAAGTRSPAGSANDVIYWIAYKSDAVS